MRLTLSGIALIAAVAAAPAVAVQPVTFLSTGIYTPGHVDATVNGTTVNEFATPLHFEESSVKKGVFDSLGFCVDLPHPIYVGVGYQLKSTLNFHVAPLTSDGYGKALTSLQVREITGLAHLGFTIAKGSAADKPAQLAAIQQAIWTLEYPSSTFAATGSFAAAQTSYAADFLKAAPKLSGFARFLTSDSGNIQAQATDVGGVPEPLVWVEMMAGFALVGAVSRNRRGLTTIVAA